MTRVLITGSTGILGHALLAAHVAQGDCVHTAQRSAVAEDRAGAAHHQVDVSDAAAVGALLGAVDPELVLHLAAESTLAVAEANPALARASIAAGTDNVLSAAAELARPPAVIVASSIRAYAPTADGLVSESHPLARASVYAAAKAQSDHSTREAAEHGLRTAVLRLSHVYGPGDPRSSRIVPSAIACALDGRPLSLRSSGESRHDFLYVSDAVSAFGLVAGRLLNRADGVSGRAFNAGGGRGHTIFEVAELVSAAAGADLAIASPTDAPQDSESVLDCARLMRETGWTRATTLADGIGEVVRVQRELLSFA